MKPLYLMLAIVLFGGALYAWAFNMQASRDKAAPDHNSIAIDDVIDEHAAPHIKFASKHLCMTPESELCWESQPEVEIQ